MLSDTLLPIVRDALSKIAVAKEHSLGKVNTTKAAIADQLIEAIMNEPPLTVEQKLEAFDILYSGQKSHLIIGVRAFLKDGIFEDKTEYLQEEIVATMFGSSIFESIDNFWQIFRNYRAR